MKKNYLMGVGLIASLTLGLFSCNKSNDSSNNISTPQFSLGQTLTTTSLQSGNSYKGTMTSGQTYTFNGPIIINKGDTLLMQSGVKLLATDPSACLVVYGTFISLGTEQNPNWITGQAQYNSPSTYKFNNSKSLERYSM
jgi:hypothetical protein